MISKSLSLLLLMNFGLLACSANRSAPNSPTTGEVEPVGGAKGNGGDTESINRALQAFQKHGTSLFSVNFRNEDIQHLDRPENINCEYIQSAMSYGLRQLWFLSLNKFVFRDPKENLIFFPSLDIEKILNTYLEATACVKVRPEDLGTFDYLSSSAKIIILPQNPFKEFPKSLMGLNFTDSASGNKKAKDPRTGKIFIFANNWLSSKVIAKNDVCKIELDRVYSGNPDLEFQIEMGDLQKNCLYLTHLGVATHELLAVNGVKGEQNNRFDFSSYFPELLTFNKAPSSRAIAYINEWRDYYREVYRYEMKLYSEVLYATDALLEMSWEEFMEDGNHKGPTFESLYVNLKGLRFEERNIRGSISYHFLLSELIQPSSQKSRLHYQKEFSRRFFDPVQMVNEGTSLDPRFVSHSFLLSLSSENVLDPTSQLTSLEEFHKLISFIDIGSLIASQWGMRGMQDVLERFNAPLVVQKKIFTELVPPPLAFGKK